MKKQLLEKKVWCCGENTDYDGCCAQHYEWMCFNTCNDGGYGGNYMVNGGCVGGSPNPIDGTCGSYTPGLSPLPTDDFQVATNNNINTNKNFKMNKSQLRDLVRESIKELLEGKKKGLDGKACWDGYKLQGTKMKGGKRVDNCVKMEEDLEEVYSIESIDEIQMIEDELNGLNEKKGKCKPSKGKRFAKRVSGKCRSFGQKGKAKKGGDRIRPGTAKGHAYCARSAKIKKCKNPPCANALSRKKWKCQGSRSVA